MGKAPNEASCPCHSNTLTRFLAPVTWHRLIYFNEPVSAQYLVIFNGLIQKSTLIQQMRALGQHESFQYLVIIAELLSK